MQQTVSEFDSIIVNCRDIFAKKMKDYGSGWRILRISSRLIKYLSRLKGFTNRTKGCSKIEEDSFNEFIGIVNYSIIGLIQMDIGVSEQSEELDEKKLF